MILQKLAGILKFWVFFKEVGGKSTIFNLTINQIICWYKVEIFCLLRLYFYPLPNRRLFLPSSCIWKKVFNGPCEENGKWKHIRSWNFVSRRPEEEALINFVGKFINFLSRIRFQARQGLRPIYCRKQSFGHCELLLYAWHGLFTLIISRNFYVNEKKPIGSVI